MDGSAETEAQSVQLWAQHSESNVASCSTANHNKKEPHVGTSPGRFVDVDWRLKRILTLMSG